MLTHEIIWDLEFFQQLCSCIKKKHGYKLSQYSTLSFFIGRIKYLSSWEDLRSSDCKLRAIDEFLAWGQEQEGGILGRMVGGLGSRSAPQFAPELSGRDHQHPVIPLYPCYIFISVISLLYPGNSLPSMYYVPKGDEPPPAYHIGPKWIYEKVTRKTGDQSPQ